MTDLLPLASGYGHSGYGGGCGCKGGGDEGRSDLENLALLAAGAALGVAAVLAIQMGRRRRRRRNADGTYVEVEEDATPMQMLTEIVHQGECRRSLLLLHAFYAYYRREGKLCSHAPSLHVKRPHCLREHTVCTLISK